MWLGLIMAANVWFVIWPNQKKALGIVPAEDAAKAKAASLAMMASRTNLILSLPMLYCMVTQPHVADPRDKLRQSLCAHKLARQV